MARDSEQGSKKSEFGGQKTGVGNQDFLYPNRFFVFHVWLLLFMLCFPVFNRDSFSQAEPPAVSVATEEPPRTVLSIDVKDNNLSVELRDAEFGKVMDVIAEKAGFTVGLFGDVYSKKISTSFKNIDMERGILRLLLLLKEKNYSIYYDPKGLISKLEIYGSPAPEKAAPAPRQPVAIKPPLSTNIQKPLIPAAPAAPPKPSLPPRISAPPKPVLPAVQPRQPMLPPATKAPQLSPPTQQDIQREEIMDILDEEDAVDEVPYIPPTQKPVYIPPK